MRNKIDLIMLIALALPASLWGQWRLIQADRRGGMILALGVCLFVGGLWLSRYVEEEDDRQMPAAADGRKLVANRSLRIIAILQAILLWIIAFQLFEGNRFTLPAVFAWLWGIAMWLLAVGERANRSEDDRAKINHWFLIVAAIAGIALFFRFFRLDSVPLELWSDQAEKLLDVNDVLNGQRPIFFPRNTGREAMQFYLTAALIWITPLQLSHLALKVGTALVGLIAIPYAYLLGKELFDRRLGLLAALLLSFSHWHVALSRIGLRFPFTAAFVAPTLYYLLRAFRQGRRNDWLAAGIFLGLGLHTYIPMRIVPLLLAALVAGKALFDWVTKLGGNENPTEASGLTSAYWLNAILSAITALALFLPLLRYMTEQPEMFWMRVTTRSSNAMESQSVSEIGEQFLINLKDVGLMFNVVGGGVWSNTVSLSPTLGVATGALFALGIGQLLWRLIAWRDRRSIYLFLILFFMVLPSALSINFPQENPSVVRTGGAIPAAMIIAALPLWTMWGRLETGLGKRGEQFAGMLAAALVCLGLLYNYDWYFRRYDQQFRASAWNSREIAAEVTTFVANGGDLYRAYHVPYPHWVDSRAIGVNAGDIVWYRNAIIDLPVQLPFLTQQPDAMLFVLHKNDDANLIALQEAFPDGESRAVQSSLDSSKDFRLFFVPGAVSP